MRDFRFSCNVFAVRSHDDFVRCCQDAERYGYDTDTRRRGVIA